MGRMTLQYAHVPEPFPEKGFRMTRYRFPFCGVGARPRAFMLSLAPLQKSCTLSISELLLLVYMMVMVWVC